MRLQLLSDLHLETEAFEPTPAPGADLLVLAGDVDSSWRGFEAFKGWPVPIVFVPGNHEYDGRDLAEARAGLRALSDRLGFVMLDDQAWTLGDAQGRRVRFLGSTRWSDFDLFGAEGRERAMRAGSYFQRVMAATVEGRPFDAPAVREQALRCRAWLEAALATPCRDVAATVVITHFAPSLHSADPRYGPQPGTASFCNDDEGLLPQATLWLHGHLHCQHDYRFAHARGSTRVVCNARGHARKGETRAFEVHKLLDVFAGMASIDSRQASA